MRRTAPHDDVVHYIDAFLSKVTPEARALCRIGDDPWADNLRRYVKDGVKKT